METGESGEPPAELGERGLRGSGNSGRVAGASAAGFHSRNCVETYQSIFRVRENITRLTHDHNQGNKFESVQVYHACAPAKLGMSQDATCLEPLARECALHLL